jgi:hypothetical protein
MNEPFGTGMLGSQTLNQCAFHQLCNSKICFHLSSMNEVVCFVLFCSYEIHLTGMMLQIVFLVGLWKALNEEGCMAWFHDVWTCSAKVLEY